MLSPSVKNVALLTFNSLDGVENPAVQVTLHVPDRALAKNVDQQKVDQTGWGLVGETLGSIGNSTVAQMYAAVKGKRLDLLTDTTLS